jgi:hypothetical protein
MALAAIKTTTIAVARTQFSLCRMGRPGLRLRKASRLYRGGLPAFAEFNARIKRPCGFRLYVAASEREWLTPTMRANFLVYSGLEEDPHVAVQLCAWPIDQVLRRLVEAAKVDEVHDR